jgi:hypothetical protein
MQLQPVPSGNSIRDATGSNRERGAGGPLRRVRGSIYLTRMLPLPLQTYLMILVGLVTTEQEDVIAYLQTENKVLREQLDVALAGKRIRFTERQRRRLAELGRRLGWRRLAKAGEVLPDRDSEDDLQVACQVNREEVRQLRAAEEAAGIEPAPERRKGMSWSELLRIHWGAIASCDFFNVEVLTLRGYVRFQVFFAMRLATREVEIAGISPNVNGSWMLQMAQNLTDAHDGFLLGVKYLIHDRDPLFTRELRDLLEGSGVTCTKQPAKSVSARRSCGCVRGAVPTGFA